VIFATPGGWQNAKIVSMPGNLLCNRYQVISYFRVTIVFRHNSDGILKIILMKSKLLLSVLFLVLSSTAFSQEYIFRLMERRDLRLSEITAMAQQYFDASGTGPETGYKHFQRWLFEQRFHTNDNGYLIDPAEEWETWLRTTPTGSLLDGNAGPDAITWNELGPWGWTYTSGWNPGTGRLTDVAIHPADTTKIYVTSPGGGIWKSTNSGNTWTPLQDFNATWMNMFAVTIDPLNQNTIYAGNSSGGVEKSTNAGATWTTLSTGATGTVRKIVVHPSNSNIVFVCSSNGIRRSTNGGTTWTGVYTSQIEDMEFKTDNSNIIVAVGSNNVVRSTDNGVTWTVLGAAEGITLTGRRLVSVSPANPNVVYIVQANGSEFGRLYRSSDAGATFTTTIVGSSGSGTNFFGYTGSGTGGQATYDMAMCVSPTDANDVYIAGIIVWRSTNGGTSFAQQTIWSYPNAIGYNHADVHGMRWVNNTIYSNSDGGIFKSMDKADNWTNISTGLGIRQFYRISCSPTDVNVITGGAQDNGSVARRPTGNWVDWLGADGMEGLVSPTNVNNLWGTSQNGAIYRSTNGGSSYGNLTQPSSGNWVTPMAIHPTNQNTLYGGWTGFYKSTNGGVSWTLLSGATITGRLEDIAIAPSDTNYIYTSAGSTLYVSTNAGVTWAVRTVTGTISDICVHRTIPSKVYVTTTSVGNQLQVSTNAGASFTNISTGLPAVSARSVAIENNAVQGLYVGMNTGVYYKNDTMSAWGNYSGNLPAVAVNELEIQYATGRLRMATYGRGVWDAPLFVAGALPVKWLSFTGSRETGGIRLQWKVSGETTHTRYELQRSTNGIVFNALATLPAQGRSGAVYEHLDATALGGMLHYRVKETDNGRTAYSNIISIRSDDRTAILTVAPNPVRDGLLHFAFANAEGKLFEVNLLAADGRIMLIHKQTNGNGMLDVAHLPKGVYQMVIKQGGETHTARVVIAD
jgi:hypothetical protein